MTPLDRRRFLRNTAALGAAAALGSGPARAQFNPDYDVIIIGAGMAGLAAARSLVRKDLKVLVLEARERTGGRIYTAEDELVFHGVELGAQFVHGTQAPTWELIREYGIETMPRDELGEVEYRVFSPGQTNLVPDQVRMASTREELRLRYRGYKGEDISYAAWASQQGLGTFAREVVAADALSWSAEPDRISVAAAIEDGAAWEQYRDRDYIVLGGYKRLLQHLEAELKGKIRLDARVSEIVWAEGLVGVFYNDRGATSSVTARSLIITLPIGVLQSDTIKMTPPLLPWKLTAINSFEMGQAVVVPMTFKEPFWRGRISEPGGWLGDGQRIVFTVPHNEQRGGNAISGWFTGTAASRLSELGPEAGMAQVLTWLEQASGVGDLASSLTWHRFQDWVADPYSLGSYSFPRPGGSAQREALQRPLSDTLFFAGEATAEAPHYQTVHGAFTSGKRAAQEVIAALSAIRTEESG